MIKINNNNLPKGWRKVRLGEVVDVYGGGTPSTSNSNYWGGNIPWLTPAEVVALNDYRFIEKTERYITEDGLRNSSAKIMPPNSLLLTSRATIGEIVINKVPMATNQGFINIKPKNIDLFFLYYWLKNNKKYLNQLAIGSTFNELSKSVFKKIETFLPQDISEQKRIADILSAFDEKIELNNKINKTLEEMAQAIFKEWFVNFRFPGHEKVKLVDSELGKIPEGWKVKELKELANLISRGSSLQYVSQNGIPVLNQRCIRNGEIILEAVQYAKPVAKKFYLQLNDILINSMGTGTLGRVSRNLSIDYPMIIHNCITFVRAKDTFIQVYLYYQIKSKEKYFEQLAIGSTGQQSLPLDMIRGIRILFPQSNLDILKKFYKKVAPFWKLIGQNKKENQTLVALRDLLLPKLMSGEIRV